MCSHPRILGSMWGYSLDTEWKTMLYKTSRWTYILGLLERSSRITSRASSAVHRLHSKSSGTWYKVLIGCRDLCFYFSWPIVSILTGSGWLLDRCNWWPQNEKARNLIWVPWGMHRPCQLQGLSFWFLETQWVQGHKPESQVSWNYSTRSNWGPFMSILNFELGFQRSQVDSSIHFTNFTLFSGEILLYVKSKMPTLSFSLLISFFLSLLLFFVFSF